MILYFTGKSISFFIIENSLHAEPFGLLRPLSHDSIVYCDTPIRFANSYCVKFNFSLMRFISADLYLSTGSIKYLLIIFVDISEIFLPKFYFIVRYNVNITRLNLTQSVQSAFHIALNRQVIHLQFL